MIIRSTGTIDMFEKLFMHYPEFYPQFVNVIVSIPFYRIPDSVSGCTRIASIPFNQSHFNANE